MLKVGSGDQKRMVVQYVFRGEEESFEFLVENDALERLNIVPVHLAKLEAWMAKDVEREEGRKDGSGTCIGS